MKTLILVPFILLFSCNTIHKVFSKNKVKTDSVTWSLEKADSTHKVDSIAIHKNKTTETNDILIEFDNGILFRPSDSAFEDGGIYVWPTDPKDYFSFDTKTGKIETNKKIKSVSIKLGLNQDIIDSIAKSEATVQGSQKENTTKVTTTAKTVNSTKTTKRVPFTLIIISVVGLALLILFFIVWRKKKQIDNILPPL